jgi:hypothetical protein
MFLYRPRQEGTDRGSLFGCLPPRRCRQDAWGRCCRRPPHFSSHAVIGAWRWILPNKWDVGGRSGRDVKRGRMTFTKKGTGEV